MSYGGAYTSRRLAIRDTVEGMDPIKPLLAKSLCGEGGREGSGEEGGIENETKT